MARLEFALTRVTAKGVLQMFTGNQVGPDGILIQNNGGMIILLTTGIGSSNMTILLPRNIDGSPPVNNGPTFTIPGANRRWFGPFDPAIWNQGGASGGVLFVDFSASSTLLIALQLG